MINLHERMLPTSAWLNPRPPGLQSDRASNWATEAGNLDFQDKRHGGHLWFTNSMTLAIFDLQVTQMLPTTFRVNWPFSSGEEAKNRFSRWLPWRPSSGIILAPDFCERKNPTWTKTVRDFQIQWDFFFALSDKLSEIFFFFFFFVKVRFCIRIVCISN